MKQTPWKEVILEKYKREEKWTAKWFNGLCETNQ